MFNSLLTLFKPSTQVQHEPYQVTVSMKGMKKRHTVLDNICCNLSESLSFKRWCTSYQTGMTVLVYDTHARDVLSPMLFPLLSLTHVFVKQVDAVKIWKDAGGLRSDFTILLVWPYCHDMPAFEYDARPDELLTEDAEKSKQLDMLFSLDFDSLATIEVSLKNQHGPCDKDKDRCPCCYV